MNRKLPLNGYKWADKTIFTDDFIKNYDDEGDKGYLLEVHLECPVQKNCLVHIEIYPFYLKKGLT